MDQRDISWLAWEGLVPRITPTSESKLPCLHIKIMYAFLIVTYCFVRFMLDFMSLIFFSGGDVIINLVIL